MSKSMESSIITGQYVRIEQTPAGIGARIAALVIDDLLIFCAIFSLFSINGEIHVIPENILMWVCIFFIFFYSLLCEIFNNGQTLGKYLLKLRIIKVDGSVPTLGSYLLRWLLYPIDMGMGLSVGLLCVLFTRNRQRLGDLAGGTMVVKEPNYRNLHVSLDEFKFLQEDYRPTYVQAADLSLEQVNVITRTLQTYNKKRNDRIAHLSNKVISTLHLPPGTHPGEELLSTLLRDYQYYALEDIYS